MKCKCGRPIYVLSDGTKLNKCGHCWWREEANKHKDNGMGICHKCEREFKKTMHSQKYCPEHMGRRSRAKLKTGSPYDAI